MQAIDRTHRLGQFKPIYATRFIIEDTVEERIIKLQARDRIVIECSFASIYLSRRTPPGTNSLLPLLFFATLETFAREELP